MTTLSYTVPTAGTDLNSIADPEIATALSSIKTAFNGNIDSTNITAALAQSAAVNQAAQVVKGTTNISTSQSTSSTSYTTLATPDQVQNVVLPANGLISVWYQAMWQESVAGAGRAAIFVGANQLLVQSIATAAPATQAAATSSATAAINVPLFTLPIGLATQQASSGFTADATTGQAVGLYTTGGTVGVEIGGTTHLLFNAGNVGAGGACSVFAAAGTYTVSVQFKASSGSVTASNRKLWVQAISFS